MIAKEIGKILARRGWTLAVAESCTGGLLGARITAVSGSSDYFFGGIIAYADAAKIRELAVDPTLLARRGAVSAPVAAQMARGVRRRFRAHFGLGVTGIAGPTGGAPGKPVGRVYIAVAGPAEACRVRAFRFAGGRAQVRRSSCAAALRMLKAALTSRSQTR
jgi:nicotinamide-nucleotide amidase